MRRGRGVNLLDPDWTPPFVQGFDQSWYLAGNLGSTLYLTTQDGAVS